MGTINDIVRFYRDCYQFDLKGINVSNFLSKECTHPHIPETFEILDDKHKRHPIDSFWGKAIEQTLLMDSKEKILYAGSIFVKANTKLLGKLKKNYAPLYLHELNLIIEDDIYYIEILRTTINPKFIECLNAIESTANIKIDTFIDSIPSSPIGFDNIINLKTSLTALLPNWNVEEIDNLHSDTYNNQNNVAEVEKANYNTKKIYSNLIFGIFKRPAGSRGVVSELTELSNRKLESSIISEIFFHSKEKIKVKKTRPIFVPTSLSEAQKEVFYTSDIYDISLVIGPPGTGKSHTIASLAIDLINNEKSVLIASKMPQAGKVIAYKIEKEFGITDVICKADSTSFKRSFLSKLRRLTYNLKQKNKNANFKSIRKSIRDVQYDIDHLSKELSETEHNELKWGAFYHNNKSSFFNMLKAKWIEYRKRKTNQIWKISNEISKLQVVKIKLLKKYAKEKYAENLNLFLRHKRKEFNLLYEALTQKSGNLLESELKKVDFKLILRALPAWICDTQQVSKTLPLKEGLFDVVIIDEASQCDLGTIIPILYRAKKVIIVGDPKQLRHVSFLSDYQQNEFKIKNKIHQEIPNYRKSSLIDWALKIVFTQDQITFLDEHYRSKPNMIRFSNDQFYDNQLKIMRETPILKNEKNISLIEIDGRRNIKGYNEAEAFSVLKKVKAIINEQNDLSKEVCSSIGIISPFTGQIKFLKTLIRKEIELSSIKKHNLLVGTPYHFQGEERDIIHLSFAVDNESHPSTINYLNKEDVFNVSITRARDKMLIYTSIDYKAKNPKHLIVQYLNDVDNHKIVKHENDNFLDLFMEEVIDVLKENGITNFYKATNVCGVNIDLAVVTNNKTYCIDLIGYPGEFDRLFTPEHIRMLSRMKQPIFYIPYSSWVLEKEKTMRNLLSHLECKIKPKINIKE